MIQLLKYSPTVECVNIRDTNPTRIAAARHHRTRERSHPFGRRPFQQRVDEIAVARLQREVVAALVRKQEVGVGEAPEHGRRGKAGERRQRRMQGFETARVLRPPRVLLRRRRADHRQRQCLLDRGADALRAQLPRGAEGGNGIARPVARGKLDAERVQDVGEVAGSRGIVGANAQGLLQRLPRLVEPAGVLQHQPEVVPGLGKGRPAGDGVAVARRRLLEVAQVVQHQAERVRKDRLPRIEAARARQRRARLVEFPALVRDDAEPVQRARVVRRLRHDLAQHAAGPVGVTGAMQVGGRAEGEFDVGKIRHAGGTGRSRPFSGR